MEGNIIKNASELGHLIGHLSRGKFRVCYRFDWFCGLFPDGGFPKFEQQRHLIRFLFFVALVFSLRLLFSHLLQFN